MLTDESAVLLIGLNCTNKPRIFYEILQATWFSASYGTPVPHIIHIFDI